MYEILWVKVGNVFVGVLYHPPKPCYTSDSFLDYLESTVNEIVRDFPTADIVLAGDFNQLPDDRVVQRTGLSQIVHQPTRGTKLLDRIYESIPIYTTVRVITSVVKTDHKAVVAYPSQNQCAPLKTTTKRTFRKKSPNQHASFLKFISAVDIDNNQPSHDTQAEFDHFYNTALLLLNEFYPERTISISSRDPEYITPIIKASLRRKNRLMHAGRVEEASALAEHIGKEIDTKCKTRLTKLGSKVDSKGMWAAVKQLSSLAEDTGSILSTTSLLHH